MNSKRPKPTNFQKAVRGSFGMNDGLFAVHHNDQKKAEWLKQMILEGDGTVEEALAEARTYLESNSYPTDHDIERELQKMREFLK